MAFYVYNELKFLLCFFIPLVHIKYFSTVTCLSSLFNSQFHGVSVRN